MVIVVAWNVYIFCLSGLHYTKSLYWFTDFTDNLTYRPSFFPQAPAAPGPQGDAASTLRLDSNPLHWSVDKVVRFIKKTDCAPLAKIFKEQVRKFTLIDSLRYASVTSSSHKAAL